MFQRILIANRGEIAVRVVRACREMGVESVCVFSDADARSLHVTVADHAVRIGPAPATESYLSVGAIIDAARQSGANAIHPGYGFLSENAQFARACVKAGIVFIGPPGEALERMGSKIAAREVARQVGVPVVPGEVPVDQTDDAIAAAAYRVGFPLLLKPSAGGGGIGMKEVRDAAALPASIAQSRREAVAAFDDGTLFVELLIEQPRHVEFQILADNHGNVVHAFERECSIQRRHQKVIEETPSVALTPALRNRMGQAAVAIARAAEYRNAGTVEFLLDGRGDNARFYFLEMNARLQVEHPVTEQVTGIDLVRAQINIAANEPLPWTQDALSQRGHAIELRVYAEDPSKGYLPQAGILALYREPSMPGIRIDAGVVEGSEVSVHYDPLLSKLIATGETREIARQRARAALRSYAILGIRTNTSFLLDLVDHERFVTGDLDTRFIDAMADGPGAAHSSSADVPPEALAVAAFARSASRDSSPSSARLDPWTLLRDARV